jgi:hypothetical protein
MTRRLSLSLLALAANVAAGCAGHNRYDPFIVPQSRIYDSVKIIALDPTCACGVPQELTAVDPDRGRFDSLLTLTLHNAGFTVVPPSESQAIWKHVTDSLGGLFNPTTGERDSSKFAQTRMLTMQVLRSRFHADGWLHPIIVAVSAKFAGGSAKWDGTSQSYMSFGKRFLASLVGGMTYGKTPALSLYVEMEDMRGNVLYRNAGGLQLYELPSGQDFATIPLSQLYADTLRNRTAVHLALGPLVTRALPATPATK